MCNRFTYLYKLTFNTYLFHHGPNLISELLSTVCGRRASTTDNYGQDTWLQLLWVATADDIILLWRWRPKDASAPLKPLSKCERTFNSAFQRRQLVPFSIDPYNRWPKTQPAVIRCNNIVYAYCGDYNW